jgi:hypothetical protein
MKTFLSIYFLIKFNSYCVVDAGTAQFVIPPTSPTRHQLVAGKCAVANNSYF